MKRVNIKAILSDPSKRRRLMTGVIIATQAREGIFTTQEQAEAAYDKVQLMKKIDPKKLKVRDPLMVKVINGVTKAGVQKDQRKEQNRTACRKPVAVRDRDE